MWKLSRSQANKVLEIQLEIQLDHVTTQLHMVEHNLKATFFDLNSGLDAHREQMRHTHADRTITTLFSLL